MTDRPLDAPLLDRTEPGNARPLPVALQRARSDVLGAARDLFALGDEHLADPWTWIGGSESEVRYGAYRAAEILEFAELAVRRMLAPAEATDRQAARIIGPASAARWDLHGLLCSLGDAELDADPGGGEWPIRVVVGHIISGQRGYGWGTAWWLEQERAIDDPTLPPGIPDDLWETLPDESTAEAAGGVADLRARLDDVLDLGAERLAGLPDSSLSHGARWSGFPVTVAFRLGRWSSHIREHAIQVEKTFARIGYVPDERARLVRHVLSTYGRTEALVFGRDAVEPATHAAVERVALAAAEAGAVVGDARRATGA